MRLELDVGPVAHGGHCVARHEGRVVFVRHALPGERVRVDVTEDGDDARFWRADAVEVVEASPHRVDPRCPAAGPGRCGGCDWQHADLGEQRRLKAAVIAEQLRRLAGLDIQADDISVEPVPGDADGLGWRTRVRLAVGDDGHAGLRRHRSHEVVAVDDCPLAHPGLDLPGLLARDWPPGSEVLVTGGDGRAPTVQLAPAGAGAAVQHLDGPTRRREGADGRTWWVSGSGFWQVHPGAADALVTAVREALHPRVGESVLDLYSGVGLFAGALAVDVGPGGHVVAVESAAQAVSDARRNVHDLSWVRLEHQRVDRYLRQRSAVPSVDLVVLDPARTGAGAGVCRAVAHRRPRRIAYVACDPAALARDLRTFAGLGYAMSGLRAFDMFPMTHHVECVATLRPSDAQGRMVADQAGSA